MQTFKIIENNDDFIIINKPANISFHNENDIKGIFSQLKKTLGYDIWPVHRLDKITSGLLIFAKNKAVAATFGDLFENKALNKVYIAISDKKPKKKQGKIVGDMQKTRGGSWKLIKTNLNPAITTFTSCSLIPGNRLFWITPLTGKTHQIRVALKSLGSAISGDTRYSGTPSDRGYLHAYKISFNWNGVQRAFKALPEEGELFLLPQLAAQIKAIEGAQPKN